MPKRSGLIRELIFLFCVPIVFICFYAYSQDKSLSVIPQHLILIASFVLGVYTVELIFVYLGIKHSIGKLFSIKLRATLFFLLLIYYFSVLVSLKTWGKVITLELMVTYGRQAPSLLSVLGISISLTLIAIAIAYFSVFLSTFILLRNNHWKISSRYENKFLATTLLFAVALFCFNFLFNYYDSPPKFNDEPIYRTLHSGKVSEASHRGGNWPKKHGLEELELNSLRQYSPNKLAEKPNIIVLLSDALRPDHMGVYGYHRNTTPNLTEHRGKLSTSQFSNVRSSCAETACAHASLFFSRHLQYIPQKPFSLQSVLKKHGYSVRFIISGDHVNFNDIRSIYGNEADHYFDASMISNHYMNDDNIIINHSLSLPTWDGKPTFIHYHLLSNHVLGYRNPDYQKYLPHKAYTSLSINPQDISYVNHYDNGVLQMDSVMKQLLDILESKGYLEDAIIVIMSDHGESLGEHMQLSHAGSVYEQALRIPLIFFTYGKKYSFGEDTDKFASIVDIAPTILKALNMPIPTAWQGIPLQEKRIHDTLPFEMYPYAGYYLVNKNIGTLKYWRHHLTQEEFLFNLDHDIAESDNLIWKTSTDLAENLRRIYQQSFESDYR